MSPKLTHKQEKFAQEIAKGSTQKDAYITAYNAEKMTSKTIDERASVEANKDKVATRIATLTTKIAELVTSATAYDIQKHFEELEDIRELAVEKNQLSTAGKMVELKGKSAGLYVDKSVLVADIKGDINVTILAAGRREK